MIVNWVDHVHEIVQHETRKRDAESSYVVCKVPTVDLNKEAKIKTYPAEPIKPKPTREQIFAKKDELAARPSDWKSFWYAQQNRPVCWNKGKKSVRGKAKGVGQVLAKSFIKPQTSIDNPQVHGVYKTQILNIEKKER